MTKIDGTTLDAVLASSRLPERTVPICLRGDLVASFEELERDLHAAQENPQNDSMAGNVEARAIAEQMEALRSDMLAGTVTLRLRAVTNPKWNRLVADHEPRDGNAADKSFGYNHEAFFPALVRACLVDVTEAQWVALYDAMSSGQFEQLSDAAVSVSRRRVDPPRSFAASEALRSGAATQD